MALFYQTGEHFIEKLKLQTGKIQNIYGKGIVTRIGKHFYSGYRIMHYPVIKLVYATHMGLRLGYHITYFDNHQGKGLLK